MALSEFWRTLILATVPAIVGGGVIVGGVEYFSKDRELDIEMVKVAVEILRVDPEENPQLGDAGRGWAMRLINKFAGEPLTAEEMQTLGKRPLSIADSSRMGPIEGAVTSWERELRASEFEAIKDFLCIPEEVNSFDLRMRTGISMWSLNSFRSSDVSAYLTSKAGASLLLAASQEDECPAEYYKNYYERFRFSSDSQAETKFVKVVLAEANVQDSGETRLSEVREHIKSIRNSDEFKDIFSPIPGMSDDEVSQIMYRLLSP